MLSIPNFDGAHIWVGGLMIGGSGIQAVQGVFLLLLVFVAIFAGLARRLKMPYPFLLFIAGLLGSFVPGLAGIGFRPGLVFVVLLAPFVYSAAWTLSWREFQRNSVSIAMLAVGLVLFTVLGLAMAAGSLLPGFDWKSAVLLGAVTSLINPLRRHIFRAYSQANGTRVTSSETAGERDSGQRRWPVVGTGSGEG